MISIITRFRLNPRNVLLASRRSVERTNLYATQSNLLNVNTNVAKDVILYKSDSVKYFKYLNYFGISQLFFWTYLAHWAFTSMKDAPVEKAEITDDTPWWRKVNLGENKYKNSLAVFCLLFGYGMFSGSWTFTLRSVRYVILRKGGQNVSVVTYTPFGENRIMEVPLDCISAAESRSQAKASLPLKVKGKRLYYLMDMRGEFRNPLLFDATVRLRRQLS